MSSKSDDGQWYPACECVGRPLSGRRTRFTPARAAQLGVLVNAVLAGVKFVAGLVGNSFALVADAIESAADIVGSLVVWGGLAVAARPADDDHRYGHGKAEALAGSAVALLLVGAAVGS